MPKSPSFESFISASSEPSLINKAKAMLTPGSQPGNSPEHSASRLIALLCSEPSTTKAELKRRTDNILAQAGGWRERFGAAIITGFQKILEEKEKLPTEGLLADAIKKATDAANKVDGLVRDHPIFATAFAIFVAIGVAYLLIPLILEAVGFGAVGIAEDSWAAWWMSTYGGATPAGSLYAFLQSLGMTIATTGRFRASSKISRSFCGLSCFR